MKKLIERKVLGEIRDHLSSPEISLIIGPRQAGKTTLLKLLEKELISQGEKTLFFNLDIERDAHYVASQNRLLEKIRLEWGDDPGFVFIDEVQRKKNAGLFLKGLYDQNLPYKFIVTGSGSIELKESIHESLVGRKRIFELPTVSFGEFVHFRTGYRYRGKLERFMQTEPSLQLSLLKEYLCFGGYPAVILAPTAEEKNRTLAEIVSSYLDKDISQLLQLERPDSYVKMLKLLAAQCGQLVNYSELAALAGLSQPTLKKYLWYAEKTFVLHLVAPFYTNKRKEIVKSPVVYFSDLGFRNYLLGLLPGFDHPREAGFLFQNLVYHLLRERLHWSGIEVKYWRTTDRAEVDFVLDRTRTIIPIEVKYKSMQKPEMRRSMLSFIERYQPEEAWVVNLDYAEEQKIGKTKILFQPFYKLLGD